MNCEDIMRLVHDYGTGRLPDPDRREYAQHMDSCAACQGFFRRCGELSCKDFIEFLDDYVEARLDPVRREIFEFHLGVCPDCTAYLESYRTTIRLAAGTKSAEERFEDAPPDLLKAIFESLRGDA